MISFIFLILLSLLVYTYLAYPLLVGLLSLFKKKTINNLTTPKFPSISIVIPAYNEEGVITQKINNTLQLDYPSHLLQIIIVTDGSTDETVNLASMHQEVEVLHNPIRLGKSSAINIAMLNVKNEITIFTDANTILNTSCLKTLVQHYSDHNIGAVACEKKISNNNKTNIVSGMEGFYWKYESLVKQLESNIHSVIGAAGELFSIKTSLFKPLDSAIILDDFMISSSILQQGYRIQYEKKSFAIEPPTISLFEEAKRKIRIGAGAAQTIAMLGFKPYSNTWLNIQYYSRRVIRWAISPIALFLLFFLNKNLLQNHEVGSWYNYLFILQVIFYILAAVGFMFYLLKQSSSIVLLPFYFLFMNTCMFIGFVQFFLKKHTVIWQKAKREIA